MNLIDKERLLKTWSDECGGECPVCVHHDTYADVCLLISNAPVIAPDIVKHGYWIPCVVERRMGQMRAMRCSVCGAEEIKGSLDTNDFLKYHPHCRMCGAKLDEEEER